MSRFSLSGLSLDLLQTVRGLRRQPVFTVVVTASLALGIGAMTALASFVEATLVRPLPVASPDELVQFRWESRSWFPDMQRFVGTGAIAPVPNAPMFQPVAFEEVRSRVADTADVFAFSRQTDVNASLGAFSGNPRLQMVSGNYFSTLGLRAHLGRLLTSDDDRPSASSVAVVSEQFWRARLAEDPSLVGRAIGLDGTSFTVIGVAPRGFRGTILSAAPPDIWIPLAAAEQFRWMRDPRSLWWVSMMARLRPGSSPRQLADLAQGPFQSVVTALSSPPAFDVPFLRVEAAARGLSDDSREDALETAVVLTVVFGGLLAVLCINVANLLLARALGRREEFAVRVALGADRRRLLRLLLVESAVLALGGGVGGLLTAIWGVELFAASAVLPGSASLGTNPSPLAAATALTVLVGLAIGIVPAIRLTRPSTRTLGTTLRRGGATSGANPIVLGIQVASAVVLLVGAGLLMRTLGTWRSTDAGFNATRLLLFQVTPETLGYDGSPASTLVDRVVGRLRAIPGVVAVTASGPFLANLWLGRIVLDRQVQRISPRWLPVRDDFFQVFEVPVRAGRTFTLSDSVRPLAVTVIDEDVARMLFGNASPLGRRLAFDQGGPEVEVIGVVGRVTLPSARPNDRRPTLYFPAVARPADFDPRNIERRGRFREQSSTTLAVRFNGVHSDIASEIRKGVAEVDGNLPVLDLKTAAEILADGLESTRLAAAVWTVFGCATLGLTILGLYGTMSYAVARRTREIAVRLALGARPIAIARTMLAQMLRITAVGIACGIAVSGLATGLIRAHFLGVRTYDPATIAAVAATVAIVTAAAVLVPVRSALRIQPATALRCE
jgi:predicted permease